MRFFRLYPALLTYLIGALFVSIISKVSLIEVLKYILFPLFFVNNLVGASHYSHLWSIAVEMQFYVLSPWLLKKMLKSDRPWIVPLMIFIVSTFGNFTILSMFCSKGWSDSNVWNSYNYDDDWSENEGNC
jgi:peptidoglycan/LPS O-acetylase OafA/YrhL